MNSNSPDKTYYSQSVADVGQQLAVDANQGLTESEVKQRLAQYGPNCLQQKAATPWWRRLLRQFHDLLIYVLIVAAAMTAILGYWIDTMVIVGVVVINAVIGFIQEGKAEKALDGIRQLLTSSSRVIRDGQKQTLDVESLVPGDVVLLQSGDKLPADCRLVEVNNLQIQESALTGESVAISKQAEAVSADSALADRTCMGFAGTMVTYGRGRAIVVATGQNTEIGRINQMLTDVEEVTTPLTRQLVDFSKWLTIAIVILAVISFVIGHLFRGYDLAQSFMATVGLAVAAIPEGLPAIMTITLAVGVTRMAKNNAIIRKLPAVETLGSVTVICSDKTGTLTRNELCVESIRTAESSLKVDGSGYFVAGSIWQDEQAINCQDNSKVSAIVQAALLCNEAEVLDINQQGLMNFDGNPTDGAMLVLGAKAGLDVQALRASYQQLDLLPFESKHKYMATLHRDQQGQQWVWVKGAPDVLLPMCQTDADHNQIDVATWHDQLNDLTAKGERVIMLAAIKVEQPIAKLSHEWLQQQPLQALALLGLLDTARPEAIEAVRQCQQAGVMVKMITGDHAQTAAVIGKKLGIGDGENYLTGPEIDQMTDEDLAKRVMTTDIFARTTPEHKLRIVKAYQSQQQVTAMTGDGVNDAPALKRAEVGTAMGQKGTEAAKEASEMVLADDNFATISKAIEQGRCVYENLMKSIFFVLPTNGGQALCIIAAIVLGLQLPITPVQILWVNMVTAVTLALALAFEQPDADIMQRKPRERRTSIISGFLIWRVAFVAGLMAMSAFYFYGLAQQFGQGIAVARTLAVNMIVVIEVFYLINSRKLSQSCLSLKALTSSRSVIIAIMLVLVLQLAFTYLPPMQFLFDSRSISFFYWLAMAGFGFLVFLLVELEKRVVRFVSAKRAQRS